MKANRTLTVWLLVASLPFLFTHCGSSTTSDSDDSTTADVAAALSVVGELVNTVVQTRTNRASRALCSAKVYDPCDSNLKRIRYFSPSALDADGCTRGSGTTAYSVFGSATLTYNAVNCTFTNIGNSVTRTLANHYYSPEFSGRKVLVYTGTGTVAGKVLETADVTDFNGTSRTGGSTLAITSAGATTEERLNISGVHRRGLNGNDRFSFWHTIYTSSTDPILLSRTGSTATVTGGTLVVLNNRASSSTSMAFSSVSFSSTCCYPTAGTVTLTQTLSDGTSSTISTVYSSTCGSVTIDGTSTTLPSCGS